LYYSKGTTKMILWNHLQRPKTKRTQKEGHSNLKYCGLRQQPAGDCRGAEALNAQEEAGVVKADLGQERVEPGGLNALAQLYVVLQ